MTPFVISHEAPFFTEIDTSVKEAELPSVNDAEVDCNTSIDYNWAVPSCEEISRPGVQLTSTNKLEVGAPYSISRFRQWMGVYPSDTSI